MPVNDTVRTAGEKAAIFDIAVDDAGFYATAYSAVGRLDEANLEGSFKADWNGNLVWLEPCHGDTYGIAPTKEIVYTVVTPTPARPSTASPTSPRCARTALIPSTCGPWPSPTVPDITIRQQGVADGYQDWSTSGLKSPTIIGWYPGPGGGQGHEDVPGRLQGRRHRQVRPHGG